MLKPTLPKSLLHTNVEPPAITKLRQKYKVILEQVNMIIRKNIKV